MEQHDDGEKTGENGRKREKKEKEGEKGEYRRKIRLRSKTIQSVRENKKRAKRETRK